MRIIGMFLGILTLLAIGAPAASAASWMADGNKRNVSTLIVCSNNKSPRLMAELILAESKQPYLLLPAPQSNDTRIFVVLPKGPAHELAPNRVIHFIRFLNPRRVVVLNGKNMVLPRFQTFFDPNIPLMSVNCSDWERTAQELSYMLNITSLARDYKKLRDKMLSDAEMYRVISAPAPKVPAEPKAEEVTAAVPSAEAAPAAEVPAAEKTAASAPAEAAPAAAPAK